MSESTPVATSDQSMDQGIDWAREIASMRQRGTDQFDPVQFHFLEVLAQRAAHHPETVRRVIDIKIAKAIEALTTRFDQARHNPKGSLKVETPLRAQVPLQGSLGELARYASQHASADAADRLPVQYFRNTWSRISTEKQVTRALDQAPKNAGPINSHMLVLRSLALMRDVSPDYLNRFVAYVDTLLSLDQLDRERQPQGPKVASGDTGKKVKKRAGPGRPGSA